MKEKSVVEDYTDRLWNKKDLSAIDDYLDEKVVIHSSLGEFHGQDSMKKVANTWLTGFPDIKVKNNAIISDQDVVVIQWIAKGTHQGEFKGVKATGRSISYPGVTVYRIKNNKITEYWAYLDMLHILNQINP